MPTAKKKNPTPVATAIAAIASSVTDSASRIAAAVTRSPPEPKGLECRVCACRHFYVVWVRRRGSGEIWRRRQCRHCGTRITTIERRVGAPPTRDP